jgi:hypothetical protein
VHQSTIRHNGRSHVGNLEHEGGRALAPSHATSLMYEGGSAPQWTMVLICKKKPCKMMYHVHLNHNHLQKGIKSSHKNTRGNV